MMDDLTNSVQSLSSTSSSNNNNSNNNNGTGSIISHQFILTGSGGGNGGAGGGILIGGNDMLVGNSGGGPTNNMNQTGNINMNLDQQQPPNKRLKTNDSNDFNIHMFNNLPNELSTSTSSTTTTSTNNVVVIENNNQNNMATINNVVPNIIQQQNNPSTTAHNVQMHSSQATMVNHPQQQHLQKPMQQNPNQSQMQRTILTNSTAGIGVGGGNSMTLQQRLSMAPQTRNPSMQQQHRAYMTQQQGANSSQQVQIMSVQQPQQQQQQNLSFGFNNNSQMIPPRIAQQQSQQQQYQQQRYMSPNPNQISISQMQQQQQGSQQNQIQNPNSSGFVANPPIQNHIRYPNQAQQQPPQQQQQQSQPQQQQNPNQSGGSNLMNAENEKRRLIQQQLVLLLHAYKCQKKEEQHRLNSSEPMQCTLSHCPTMKQVLAHMNKCTAGRECNVPHCSSSHQIINHWKNCNRPECPVCYPLKQVNNRRPQQQPQQQQQVAMSQNAVANNNQNQQNMNSTNHSMILPQINNNTNNSSALNQQQGQQSQSQPQTSLPQQQQQQITQPSDMQKAYQALGLPYNSNSMFHQTNQRSNLNQTNYGATTATASNMNATKDWHSNINTELRQHLVRKIVHAIFPNSDQNLSLHDKRLNNLYSYARKVECDMHDKANSKEEYYHLLAEKIHRIQKELNEKRQQRRKEQQQANISVQQQQQLNSGNMMMPNTRSPMANNNNNNIQGIQSPTRGNMVVSTNNSTMTTNFVTNQQQPTSIGGQQQISNQFFMTNNQQQQPQQQQQQQVSPIQSHQMNQTNQFRHTQIHNQTNFMNNSTNNNPIVLVHQQQPNTPQQQQSFPNQSQTTTPQPRSQQQTMTTSTITTSNFSSNSANIQQQQSQLVTNINQQQANHNNSNNNNQLQLNDTCNIKTEINDDQQLSKTCNSQMHIDAELSSTNDIVGIDKLSTSSLNVNTSTMNNNNNNIKIEMKDEKSLDEQKTTINENFHSPAGGCGGTGTKNIDNSLINSNGASTGKTQTPVSSKLSIKSPGSVISESKSDICKSDLDNNNSLDKTTASTSNTSFPTTISSSSTTVTTKPSTTTSSVASSSPSTSSAPSKKKIFKPDELRQALMPTLEKLYKQTPESLPFRQPVDPEALQIPDYFSIIKHPMDLSTIKHNLDTGQYTDPWQYVDDVWLMFENAWLYNRKTSRVYRHCTKLSEVFEQEIHSVMRNLGYCCGKKHVFQPQILGCYGKQLCTIPRDAKYMHYQNRYTYCMKCFSEIPGDNVTVGDALGLEPNSANTQTIPKSQFVESKNDHLDLEPFVECKECGRKLHQVCVLHLDSIWPEGFTCDGCLRKDGRKRRENKFGAKRLPQTKLGSFIENRVNNFLRKKECGAGEVYIRVVSSSDKSVEVRPGMKQRYCNGKGDWPESFPYRAKALFAFEVIDDTDVCFFGMHVQEYGSECMQPNQRRVYLAYLDSVYFFRPKQYRTAVYHEILLGYLDYAKQLGYTMAHIWACPPSEGDDYIFHCHPPEQKIPKPKRLQEWYKKMLDKGIIERIVLDYKDILKQANEDNLKNVSELPYFEGDYWPNILEDSIKEIEMEHQKQQQQLMDSTKSESSNSDKNMDEDSIEMIDSVDQKDCDGKMSKDSNNSKQHKKNSANKKSNKKQNNRKNNVLSRLKSGPLANQSQSQLTPMQQYDQELTAKIFGWMEKIKEVFFVVRLHSSQSAASLPPVNDPDNLINCDLMEGRDAFLNLARDKHYEFSSLRRAKFSSLAMLYELHNCNNERFLYTCNNCKRSLVETRYHCGHCDDFDLCVQCYEKDGHQHNMVKIEFGDLMSNVDGDVSGMAGALNSSAGSDGDGNNDPNSAGSNSGASSSETRRQSIQRCIESLSHACQCRDANCRRPTCLKMKRIVQHAKSCKKKLVANQCQICKQLIALCCYHAKHCQESNKCQVPYCQSFKQKLQQQQIQQRFQQAQILKRRIASMSMAIHQSQNSQSSSNSNSSSSCPPQPCHMKPATATPPPAGALQAAAAVQAVARQQQNIQNMQPISGKGGKPMLPYMSSPSPSNISKPTTTMTSSQSMGMQPKMGPQSDLQTGSQQQQQWFSGPSQQPRYTRPQMSTTMQTQNQFSQSSMIGMPQQQQQQQQNMGTNLPSLLMSNQNIQQQQQQHSQQPGLNQQQQMSNQPNQNNYAQLIKTFKNSTTSTNPEVMSFIKNDPKMMTALIRTQQQQKMSMQQNMINQQQGSNMNQQIPQNQNWYSGGGGSSTTPALSQRMINPGQQRQQLNPQASQRGPASMMMNQVQNQAPTQINQQVYPNQQQQLRFSTTNWNANQQNPQQQQRLPMIRGNHPGQMNQMNTVRFINTQQPNNQGGMINSQNDGTQEMFSQQTDYGQMTMNQQPEMTPQERLSKYVENL